MANRPMTVADISTTLAADLKATGGRRFMAILKMACDLQQKGTPMATAWKFLSSAAHQCRPTYPLAAVKIILDHAYHNARSTPWRTAT